MPLVDDHHIPTERCLVSGRDPRARQLNEYVARSLKVDRAAASGGLRRDQPSGSVHAFPVLTAASARSQPRALGKRLSSHSSSGRSGESSTKTKLFRPHSRHTHPESHPSSRLAASGLSHRRERSNRPQSSQRRTHSPGGSMPRCCHAHLATPRPVASRPRATADATRAVGSPEKSVANRQPIRRQQ